MHAGANAHSVEKRATLCTPVSYTHLDVYKRQGWYGWTFYEGGRFTNMSMLMFSAAVIVFLIGLVSEQITNLTYRRDG